MADYLWMAERTILWDFDGTLAYREGLWSGCLAWVLQEHEPEAAVTRDEVRPLLKDGFPWHSPDRAHPELSTPEAWWEVVEALLIRACHRLGFVLSFCIAVLLTLVFGWLVS